MTPDITGHNRTRTGARHPDKPDTKGGVYMYHISPPVSGFGARTFFEKKGK